jgi:hypothetical protein
MNSYGLSMLLGFKYPDGVKERFPEVFMWSHHVCGSHVFIWSQIAFV